VVCDASSLLALSNEPPEQMVQTFIDYEGTTAAGLRVMMANGFPEAVHAGLDAAAKAATTFVKQARQVR
jgi:pyrroline-5-carboxylate reductase